MMCVKEKNIRDISIAIKILKESQNHSNLFIVMYGGLLLQTTFMDLSGF